METLVHLELDYDHLPRTYQLLKAEAPDQAAIQTLAASVLPPNWVDKFIASRTIGDEWLASRKTALLRVPSAVMPETSNVLLNPEHPEASQVRVCWHRRYPWDRRLFE